MLIVHASMCLVQADFYGNQCNGSGGGIYLQSMTGTLVNTTFRGNIGAGPGGALDITSGSYISIMGRLCAQHNAASANAAPTSGGFAIVRSGGTLVFVDAAIANIADNTPSDIAAVGNVTSLGVGTWSAGKAYDITGPVGDCSAAFVANTSASCDACAVVGRWYDANCSCGKVGHLPS